VKNFEMLLYCRWVLEHFWRKKCGFWWVISWLKNYWKLNKCYFSVGICHFNVFHNSSGINLFNKSVLDCVNDY